MKTLILTFVFVMAALGQEPSTVAIIGKDGKVKWELPAAYDGKLCLVDDNGKVTWSSDGKVDRLGRGAMSSPLMGKGEQIGGIRFVDEMPIVPSPVIENLRNVVPPQEYRWVTSGDPHPLSWCRDCYFTQVELDAASNPPWHAELRMTDRCYWTQEQTGKCLDGEHARPPESEATTIPLKRLADPAEVGLRPEDRLWGMNYWSEGDKYRPAVRAWLTADQKKFFLFVEGKEYVITAKGDILDVVLVEKEAKN